MKRQFLTILLLAGGAFAQQNPPPAQPPLPQTAPPPPAEFGMRAATKVPGSPPPPQMKRPTLERSLMPGPPGRWWDNPQMAQMLAIHADQQKKMDDIFQQNRLRLIDLNATLQKEELIMEPLVSADQPDETRILAQIDKVAQARAELEKANARFLLSIRRALTADQWKKLQADNPPPAVKLTGPLRPPE